MKVLSVILKIIETGIVCVWGFAVGIFFPAVILAGGEEIVAADIANSKDIFIVWLITAVLGYVISAALIFCKRYGIAAVLSLAGLVGVLYVHFRMCALYVNTPDSNGPDELYLPLIFATLLDLFILAIEKRERIASFFEEKKAEKEEKAPSILGDDDNG